MHLIQQRIALILALGIALVASAGWIVHQYRQLGACRRQQAADRQSLREFREALQTQNLQKAPARAEGQPPVVDYRAALARDNATIEQLTRELSDAQATIGGLQGQITNSNDEHEKALANADERYRKEQEDWQSRLEALKQELDTSEADLQASRQRIAALETNNAKLRGESSNGAARASEFSRAVADLQDLDRRREAHMTSLMRRYRDITSEFRAMSGMLDSSRDTNSSAISGPVLTRIQNAVSLADDDLRQLSELNDQARQLQKKLAKKQGP